MNRLCRCLAVVAGCGLVAGSAHSAEISKYVPTDTKMVVSVDLKQILGSPLLQQGGLGQGGLGQLEGMLPGFGEITKMFDEVGLDPKKDLHRVTIYSPGGNDQDRGLVVIKGTFDPKKIEAYANKKVEKNAESVRKHKVTNGLGGFFMLYEVTLLDQEVPLFVSVPTKDTLLISPGKDYVVDALKKDNLKKPMALDSKDFQSLLESLDDKKSLTIAALGKALTEGDALPDGVFKSLLSDVNAIGGGLNIGKDIELELVIGSETVNEARALNKTINDAMTQGIGLLALLATQDEQFAPVLEVVKTIRCRSKEKNVLIKAAIPGEILEELLKPLMP